MNIGELKARLADFPDDDDVFCSIRYDGTHVLAVAGDQERTIFRALSSPVGPTVIDPEPT